jgi:lysyl-tRNA synthetase class 2
MTLDRINEQRLAKLGRLRALGISPYPNRYRRSHTAEQAAALLKEIEAGTSAAMTITLGGRITAHRPMGKITFLDLRDGSGRIQLLCHKEKLSEADLALLKELDIGDIIGASGTVFRTRTGEPTLEVSGLTLLSKSLQPLPEKWHGLTDTEIRYRQRYLDLIANPEARPIFLLRSKTVAAIRGFLDGRGFVEVETPVLQSAAGGALAQPFITHHNALDRDLYLRIALELHLKRLVVGGFDKVYELGRTFRNEGVSTQHNPEFTMLETYEAYADYNDVMVMLEEMVSGVCQKVMGTAEVKFGECLIDFKPPWRRVTLRDAICEYSGIDYTKYPTADELRDKMHAMDMEADPQKNWAKLVDELLKTFVRPRLMQPTILLDYPVEMSPLAKSKPDDERVVERFQAAAGGLEIANAYTELNDPLEQRDRFTEQLEERYGDDQERWTIDEDFLTALEYGMPPTGGLGVGIDRLVMLLTNQSSIREVILFPQLKERGDS